MTAGARVARASRSSAARSAGTTTAPRTPSWAAGGSRRAPPTATGRATTWTATRPVAARPGAAAASRSVRPSATGPIAAAGPQGCDSFLTGCLQFRYGQCNQDVECMGRIVCRVVACVPPWQVDPTCTTAVAVDNSTAEQNESCWTPAPPMPPCNSPTTNCQVVGMVPSVDGGGYAVLTSFGLLLGVRRLHEGGRRVRAPPRRAGRRGRHLPHRRLLARRGRRRHLRLRRGAVPRVHGRPSAQRARGRHGGHR